MVSLQKCSSKSVQVEQLIELKEQLDLVYRQLNHYRNACRSVDKFNRAVRRTDGQLDSGRLFTEFVKFERDYRVYRKKVRKLDRQLLAVNPYEKLYDLYENMVIEESIGAGGDLIDSSAIDPAVVDEVGCNREKGIEDTSVDNFVDISMDQNSENYADIQLEAIKQETSAIATSIHSLLFPNSGVSDSARVNGQEFQCDQSYTTSSNCIQPTHSSESRFKCSWEGCDFGTNYSQSLKAHQIVHSGERPFQCSQCDKSYKRFSHLIRHKWIHSNESRFKCSWEGCDFGTNYSHALKDHQIVHLGERPFQCSQCDKSYKRFSHLIRHKWIHSNEAQFKCSWEGCDFGCHQLGQFSRHQKLAHGKPKLKT